MSSSILKTGNQQFLLDDKPIQIISGAIHYFRVMPEAWSDRLAKLKACGMNTVETYVPWNLHEPEPGTFNFDGIANLFQFIELADAAGLHVIVRPSPYICAEWEMGGLPAWLMNIPGMRLRCLNEPFMNCVNRYYDALLPRLVPYLSTNGGPIIAMQIENEYGSYGNDHDYMQALMDSMTSRGIDVLLFTSDGPEDDMLIGGTLPNILKTANFGSRSEEAFAKLREYEQKGPLMCAEYWNGWFDYWGGIHHTRDAQDVADVLATMLKAGASVNFYMFHGGTNFGFYNGANDKGVYEPTITSYDYDSLLNEAGQPTEKYYKVRDVIAEHTGRQLPDVPTSKSAKAYGDIVFNGKADLFTVLPVISDGQTSATPEPMEAFGQFYGFICYQTEVETVQDKMTLHMPKVHDRAIVYVDGIYQGVVERRLNEQSLEVAMPGGKVNLTILVENMGRVNYGYRLFDQKGLNGAVLLGQQHLFGWTIYPLPLLRVDTIPFTSFSQSSAAEISENSAPSQKPSFYRAKFTVDQPADTYLDCRRMGKGIIFINGFNLGRYWEIGPQQTLFVPGELLKSGENDLVVFELHPEDNQNLTSIDHPILG